MHETITCAWPYAPSKIIISSHFACLDFFGHCDQRPLPPIVNFIVWALRTAPWIGAPSPNI